MTSWRTVLAAAAVAASALLATPALAQEASVDDPAGDASNPGLDITGATVSNRDYRIIAHVRFVDAVRGRLIVSVDPRHARGVRLVSEHDPAGDTTNFVLPVAFTDVPAKAPSSEVKCPGFKVTWNPDRPVAVMSMPSRCLNGANFGAIRFEVLTERGDDTDYTPEDAQGNLTPSPWVPRG